MNEELEKKSIFKRWWFWLIIVAIILAGTWAVMTFVVHPKSSDSGDKNGGGNKTSQFAKCPNNLSGVLTAPLMNPNDIAGLIPLGNVAPPGHTSPVDHNYFNVIKLDPIALYAPADAAITSITAILNKKTADSDYEFDSYVVQYTICDGLILDFAGYTDVIPAIKTQLDQMKNKDNCKYDIQKVGHTEAAQGQCYFNNLNIKVTSGELIGHTQATKDASGFITTPFEIWAANYNKAVPTNTDWSYYDDDRYAHSMCTFDLYSGDLKKQFDAKFGLYRDGKFTPRTVEPFCGTVDQNIVGSLQGMWFSNKPNKDDKSGNVGATGQGISFLHYNIDPTQGEVVVGGELSNNIAGTLQFNPANSGTTNREPSEVKADGQIYCYPGHIQTLDSQNNSFDGKILVQVVDDHHIKAENQSGSCSVDEAFKTPYNFER